MNPYVFIDEGEPGDEPVVVGPFATEAEAAYAGYGATVMKMWTMDEFLASKAVAESATSCRHCDRLIEMQGGYWVDPAAPVDGDDSVWRETCDAHDTFTAEHEPV